MVSFNLRARSFADLDAWAINIRDSHPQHELASTFSLNEDANNSTVLDLTILNNDFIVWLSTSENGTGTKVHESTI
jgi:hypothetical protein